MVHMQRLWAYRNLKIRLRNKFVGPDMIERCRRWVRYEHEKLDSRYRVIRKDHKISTAIDAKFKVDHSKE